MTSLRTALVAGLAGTVLVAAAGVAEAGSDTTEPIGTEPTATEAAGTQPVISAPEYEMPSGLEGSVAVSGSSTVEPISAAVATAFAAANPDVAITVDGPGTGDGFARFCAGETDISDASRPISADEAASCADADIEFIELKIAVDGLSVITSVQNDAVDCLSFVDLYALLGPDATGVVNWADATTTADEIVATVTDLGAVHTPYPDADLVVTGPGEESGTFDSFVEIVIEAVGDELGVEGALPRLDYTASPNDSVIIDGVASNPASLGWVGFAFVEENLDTVRPLAVDGGAGCVEPTAETIASGEYPIARDLFIYVNSSNLAENPALDGYVDFYVNSAILTLIGADDGQVPFVALPADDVAATQSVWESRETGTRSE